MILKIFEHLYVIYNISIVDIIDKDDTDGNNEEENKNIDSSSENTPKTNAESSEENMNKVPSKFFIVL